MELDENSNISGKEEEESPIEPPVDPDNSDDGSNGGQEEPTTPIEPEPAPEPTYIYQTINNFYDRVRGALGLGAELSITDDMIDLYENAPYAELQIVKRVPNFCCLSDIKYALFETCIVYMTCYALCPISDRMRVKRQKDPSLELEFYDSSANHSCNRFLELVDDIITTQINEEGVETFLGFKVTKASLSIPNALGENLCCCRHWFPPIYKELIEKPGDESDSNNCPCTPEQPSENEENVKSKDIDYIVVIDRADYEKLENKDKRTQYLLRG